MFVLMSFLLFVFCYRFFVSKAELTEAPILRENSPENITNVEDVLKVERDTSLEEVNTEEASVDEKSEMQPVVKSNKENIAHR